MSLNTHEASHEEDGGTLESSESTAFYLWLIITVSAGIIMAQDSWVGMQQPRLSTVDATASFSKIMVIHAIWLVVTLGFMIFTWIVRPTSAWKIHLIVGAFTIIWTVGVLVWAFSDVENLQVSTWRCETAPTSDSVTQDFLDSCERADMGGTVRLGGDIFLWSANNERYWRWIVPGEGLSTLQTRWPSEASAMYLAQDTDGAKLVEGAENSVPGGIWSAGFHPAESKQLNIFYVEAGPAIPLDSSTPGAQ